MRLERPFRNGNGLCRSKVPGWVRFASIDDYNHAKVEGPWMVMDHYLIVKEWSPSFDPLSDSTNQVLVWVRFPCLPVEYYDKDFLMKIGRKIGRPIRVDQATSLVSRGKFARICVEIRKALIPAEITENFGPWMMVSRESRRPNKNRIGHTYKLGKLDNRRDSKNIPTKNIYRGHRQYEVLGDEENCDMGPIEDGPGQMEEKQVKTGKPEARGRRPNVKVNQPEQRIGNHQNYIETQGKRWNTEKGKKVNQNGQRQAAVEEEHVLVRGSQGGKHIVREVINNVLNKDNWENTHLWGNEMETEHHQDPPHLNTSTEEDEYMQHEKENTEEEIVKETMLGISQPQLYGSPNGTLRKRLWQDLTKEKLNFAGPWLSIRDYNSVSSEQEVTPNGSLASIRIAGLTEWMFNQGLVDLGYIGSRFTWVRGLSTNTFKGARLDRGVCTIDWRQLFPDDTVIHLPTIQSDHAPLLLNLKGHQTNKCHGPFRFQAAWLTHKDFNKVIEQEWQINLTLGINVEKLIKPLSEWNSSTFGNYNRRKRTLMARIEGVQKCLNNQPRHRLLKLETKLKQELDTILEQEELMWFQKSREEWIVSGDINTKFYHASTMVRRSRNKIGALMGDNGEWVSEEKL
ncbi:uncharacterized protein LOC142521884 [Primulina tabacum]|uniref:uncharacterized protein LOC142521884 n=1 Tax=Primulina tabacum TaxID=48773 RepID=UPI003F5A617C